MPDAGPEKKILHNLTAIAVLFVLCLAGFILKLTGFFTIPFKELFCSFQRGLYAPRESVFAAGHFLDGTPLTYFYMLILSVIVLVATYFSYFRDPLNRKSNPSLGSSVIVIGVAGLLIFAVLQQQERIKSFGREHYFIKGKTQQERLTHIFGKKYAFVTASRKLLSAPCPSQFFSDVKAGGPSVVYDRYFLAYHLYPDAFADSDARCFIIHSNRPGLTGAGPDFKPLLTMDQSRYVLAVKKRNE